MRYLLKCNPGLEDVASREALEEIPDARIVWERRGRGRVLIEASGKAWPALYRMRSIHSAEILLVEEEVGYNTSALERIHELTRASNIHRFMPASSVFAVRGERIGEGHEYTSMDVARIVGKAIQEAYEEEYGVSLEVRLESPSIAVAAEVDDNIFRLGIIIIGEKSGHRRGYRIYDHPASLKPTIAYSLLRLAGAKDNSTIMDPMCGGGTVAIEAALLFEDSKIICIDKSGRHVEGAIRNAMAARVQDRIMFYKWDARRLHELLEEDSINYVASNPPYGVRLGDPRSIRRLYREFIPSLYKVMATGGRVSLLTTESGFMMRTALSAGFRIAHVRRIRHGNLWVSLLVFEKAS